MAELDTKRHNGWSYAAGWSRDALAYVARAWKSRKKPLRLPNGVVLAVHSVSAQAADIESAALACAAKCDRRDANPTEELSEYEAVYARNVKAWKPTSGGQS